MQISHCTVQCNAV